MDIKMREFVDTTAEIKSHHEVLAEMCNQLARGDTVCPCILAGFQALLTGTAITERTPLCNSPDRVPFCLANDDRRCAPIADSRPIFAG